jgi:predicted nucleotidyltransferase
MGRVLDAEIADVLRGFPEVAAAWVYGSESRGEARPDSDLDVALLLRERGKSAADAYLLLGRIAANLERVVPGRRVDVVLIASQGPVFQHQVLSEGRRVLDADPAVRIDFESDAVVRYFDFRPTYDLARRYATPGFRAWFGERR